MSGTGNGWRWWLCGLLFAATALSFLDRQVLSVLAPVVTRELGMSSLEYSHVTTAFLVSYAVMFLVGGRVLDVVGTRVGLALSVGVWSVASAGHALVGSALQLGGVRFLLGAGEGGCFPGAAKGVAEWFAPQQRALAMGIAIGGASLGAVVAPPLTVWLAGKVGWRGVFITTGLIGIGWVVAWWRATRQVATEARAEGPGRIPLSAVAGRRDVWGLALMRFIVDPVFYFYMFWIPKYLSEVRGATQEEIGRLAWIPFLALGVSNVMGGGVSDWLVRRGMGSFTARRSIMAGAAVLTMASSMTGRVESMGLALGMMALLMLAHGFWITNYVTIISERYPQGMVGTVMGFTGAVGALGGMLANTGIGWSVDRFGYGPIWLVSGMLYPLAFGVLLVTIRSRGEERQISDNERSK